VANVVPKLFGELAESSAPEADGSNAGNAETADHIATKRRRNEALK